MKSKVVIIYYGIYTLFFSYPIWSESRNMSCQKRLWRGKRETHEAAFRVMNWQQYMKLMSLSVHGLIFVGRGGNRKEQKLCGSAEQTNERNKTICVQRRLYKNHFRKQNFGRFHYSFRSSVRRRDMAHTSPRTKLFTIASLLSHSLSISFGVCSSFDGPNLLVRKWRTKNVIVM